MDYIYDRHAVALDQRLDALMTSHTPAAPKQANADDAPSGLQAFVERQTIAQEIAAIPKVAVDINAELARDQVAGMVEERNGRFDSFLASTSPMVDSMKTAAAERTELDSHLETLRGSVTPERS